MNKYFLEFEFLTKPPSLNQLLSKGWKFRHFTFLKIKQEILNKVSGHKPTSPLKKFQISITRHAIRTLDFDNFVASAKPILDSLVMAGIIHNDTWDLINHLSVDQIKVKKNQEKTIVKVEEVND